MPKSYTEVLEDSVRTQAIQIVQLVTEIGFLKETNTELAAQLFKLQDENKELLDNSEKVNAN